MITRYPRSFLPLSAIVLFFAGCASPPEIVPSAGPRSPTSADQVKIYQAPPQRYEVLGAVTVTRDEGASWNDRGDATAGFDILKRKAAALGANGLLVGGDLGPKTHRILAGYHDEYYQIAVTDNPKMAHAQAIYMLEEKK